MTKQEILDSINDNVQNTGNIAYNMTKVRDELTGLAGESLKGYKLYLAKLTQTGTSDPIPTIIVNELSGPVVWSRFAPGGFFGTLAGEFTVGKVYTSSGVASGAGGGAMSLIELYPATTDVIGLNASILVSGLPGDPVTSQLSDGYMVNQLIEIRVYD